MSIHFVILIGTEEKRGVLNPDIIGPFPSHAAAQTFVSSSAVDDWVKSEGHCFGGWPAVHIICDEQTIDPEDWIAANDDTAVDVVKFHNVADTIDGYLAGLQAGRDAVILNRDGNPIP